MKCEECGKEYEELEPHLKGIFAPNLCPECLEKINEETGGWICCGYFITKKAKYDEVIWCYVILKGEFYARQQKFKWISGKNF